MERNKFLYRKRSLNRLLNPFYTYFIAWISTIVLYRFDWSFILPEIKTSLLLFLFVTCIIMFSQYYKTKRKPKYMYKPLLDSYKYNKFLRLYLIVNYVLLFIEFISFGMVPLFGYSSGFVDEHLYWQFGIPIVNVFVINSFAVIGLFATYCFASTRCKIYLLYILLTLLPPILCMQRGIAMNQIIGSALIYFASIKINFKTIIVTIVFALIGLFYFGVMGNMRTGRTDTMILVGQPTKKFLELGIPAEYLWAYIYAESPLGNLQNIIKKRTVFPDNSSGINNFMIQCVYPQFISKNMASKDDEGKYLLVGSLTVCTTFGKPYVTLGWWGMFFMFIYIILLYIFCIRIIDYKSPFRVPLLAVLCVMSIMSIFDNMVHYTGLFPQIMILMFLSWTFKKKKIISILGLNKK